MSLVTELLIPKDYGYVLVATASTFFLGIWHGVRVGMYRKDARLPYPKAYGDSGDVSAASSPEHKHAIYLFNTAQRAHGNYNENQPSVALAMIIAGLKYPRTTAIMGLGWIIGRIVFAVGYTRKDRTDGKGRLAGSFFWLFQLGLFGLVAYSGVQLLL